MFIGNDIDIMKFDMETLWQMENKITWSVKKEVN